MARKAQRSRSPSRAKRARIAAESVAVTGRIQTEPSGSASSSTSPVRTRAGSSRTPASTAPSPSPPAAPAAEASSTKRRRLAVRLRSRDAPSPAVEGTAAPPPAVEGTAAPATSPSPRRSVSPSLGLDPIYSDIEAQSPVYAPRSPNLYAAAVLARGSPRSPDYSPLSPTEASMAAYLEELRQEDQVAGERYLVAVGLSRDAQIDRWGRVYWRPTPTPSPPPRHEEDVPMPPVAPPSRHVPTHAEIAWWTEQHEVVDLLVRVADGQFPQDWDVPAGSNAEQRLQRLVMKRLSEGCMPWPTWQCRHCADLGVP